MHISTWLAPLESTWTSHVHIFMQTKRAVRGFHLHHVHFILKHDARAFPLARTGDRRMSFKTLAHSSTVSADIGVHFLCHVQQITMVGTRTLLGAPGIATSNKKLLGTV